jgi:hypothetical protein
MSASFPSQSIFRGTESANDVSDPAKYFRRCLPLWLGVGPTLELDTEVISFHQVPVLPTEEMICDIESPRWPHEDMATGGDGKGLAIQGAAHCGLLTVLQRNLKTFRQAHNCSAQ